MEEDGTDSSAAIRVILRQFDLEPISYELNICTDLAGTIYTRPARLYALRNCDHLLF